MWWDGAMKLVKRLLGLGLLAGIGYLVFQQWQNEASGAAEWLATGEGVGEEPSTAPEPHSVQSVPESDDELAFSDAEEEGWPAKDPFEGQDPLTAPLPDEA
jgi:uncharacterized membrane protein YebE (DUF533 family)